MMSLLCRPTVPPATASMFGALLGVLASGCSHPGDSEAVTPAVATRSSTDPHAAPGETAPTTDRSSAPRRDNTTTPEREMTTADAQPAGEGEPAQRSGQAPAGSSDASPTAYGDCGSFAGIVGDDSAVSSAIVIDFNKASRQETETNEPGWTAWPVADVATESMTIAGVTFTLSMAGTGGSSLTTDWYKAGIQSPNYARLVGDGLTVADGNSGGAIELQISGLTAGTHTLLAYHNAVDGNDWAAIDVDVDGTRQVSDLATTRRALTTDAAATSYVTFSAAADETVTVLYSPSSDAAASSQRNVIINAIALDLADPSLQASQESPRDRDYHVDADAGSVTLSWTAATDAVSHELYFGSELERVARATTASPEHVSSQTSTRFEVASLSKLQFYFWRVDEVDKSGVVTTGKVWRFAPRQLAFQGAEGYGRFARGGRCGKVVHVTNLDDSGAGSLREAVENDIGPRTIVFDVGGMIQLQSRLSLTSSYVTVAGQTAPGKGITIRSAPFGLSGPSDVIVRHMRVRLGAGQTYDGMGMAGSDHSIIDHSSISWTIDEAFSSRNAKHITLQRSLISECLNVAGHANYPAGTAHGYAASISGDVGSFHHNLLAHCEGRNWSLAGGLDGDGEYAGRLDIFNNVVYNWEGRTTDGGAHQVNFVANYYKPGPASSIFTALNPTYDGFPGTQQYYMAANVMPGHFDERNQLAGTRPDGTPPYELWVDAPFFESHAHIDSAEDAYKSVLSDVGSNAPVLDEHDVRVVEETLSGSYRYSGSVSGLPGLPDRESDVGGYEDYPAESRDETFDTDADGLPDWYEAQLGTNPGSAPGDYADTHADPDGDGYTHLDEYLHFAAVPHVQLRTAETASFDLAAMFRGFGGAPSVAVGPHECLATSVSGLTLDLTANRDCGVVFLPVTVRDAEGSSMTREVAVSVSAQ